MPNFEPRAALALLCLALLLALSGGPGQVAASGVSSPLVYGRNSTGIGPIHTCSDSAAFSVPGNATTVLVAGIASQRIYVCAFAFNVTVANTTKFVRGTGAACGTGTADMTGPYTTGTGRPIALGADLGYVLATQASDDLCITATNAGSQVNGVLSFSVF